MIRSCWIGVAVVLGLLPGLFAADAPSIWKEDAALRAVQLVPSRSGLLIWAVGDLGSIWHSADAGDSWSLQAAPTDAALQSVCFVSPQLGWAVGSGTQPFTGLGYGVVLKTTDGGRSWTSSQPERGAQKPKTIGKKSTTAVILDQPQHNAPLPPLRFVKFFNRDEGIAVGEASAAFPTGVLFSMDGGDTWEPAKGPASNGWLSADFREPDHGIVVGDRGRISVTSDLQVIRSRQERQSLRGIRAVDFADGLNAWAVGDGGTVLRSTNGGVSWEAPPKSLPPELGVFTDFQTVFAHDSLVWVAGSPGGRIWHSSDEGQHWVAQPTGITTPLHALSFVNERIGVAVGAFGCVLKTDDGGATWLKVRAGNRRAALMSWHARPERVPFNAIAKYAGENSYRAVSVIAPRWESLNERDGAGPLERRANDALLKAGAQGAEIGWRLPISLPEVDRSVDQLTAEWQKQTEGRMVEIVLSDFVAQLRQWRPSVVVLDRFAADDAVGQLVTSAAVRAITAAADATRYPEHERWAGLGPWRVERVCWQMSSRDAAPIIVDPFETLPRLKTTTHHAATSARSMLFPTIERLPQRESFEVDREQSSRAIQTVSATTDDSLIEPVALRDLFAGLSIAANSEARRAMLPLSEQDIDLHRESAIRQRNFRGIVDRHLDQPERAAGLLAQLRGTLQGLPRSQAALQLVQLADDHRRRGQWDLAEATQIEIVNQYPAEPVAAEAMLWLMRFWSSEEMSWQRSRQVSLQAGRVTTDRNALLTKLSQLVEASGQYLDDPLQVARDTKFDPKRETTTLSSNPSQDAARWRDETEKVWSQQAVALARLIRQQNRSLFDSPEVQYPLGAALRRAGMNAALMQLIQTDTKSPLTQLISKETLLAEATNEPAPTQFAVCRRTATRPHLDGLLSDDCWRTAKEIRLAADRRSPTEFNGSYPFVMLSYDDQHLYIGASLPRAEGTPSDGPQYGGRKHDADLTGFDRLTLAFDTNRDLATSYQIHIDQRGQLAEQCWEDPRWNPRLFVAVHAEPSHWRLEMAVPFAELVANAPKSASIWALSIRRTIPLTGIESWPVDAETASNRDSREINLTRAGTLQFK